MLLHGSNCQKMKQSKQLALAAFHFEVIKQNNSDNWASRHNKIKWIQVVAS